MLAALRLMQIHNVLRASLQGKKKINNQEMKYKTFKQAGMVCSGEAEHVQGVWGCCSQQWGLGLFPLGLCLGIPILGWCL